MVDDRNEVTRVNWGEVFGFSQIFKSWRLAIHPSKLLLALAAIILTCALGHIMDCIWPNAMPAVGAAPAAPDEANLFVEKGSADLCTGLADWKSRRTDNAADLLWKTRERTFDADVFGTKEGHFRTALATALETRKDKFPKAGEKDNPDSYKKNAKDSFRGTISNIKDDTAKQASLLMEAVEQARKEAAKAISDGKNLKENQTKKEALEQLESDYVAARKSLTDIKVQNNRSIRELTGVGIFDTFWGYERNCVSKAIAAAANGNIFKGVMSAAPLAAQDKSFLANMLDAAKGIEWLIIAHPFYGITFLLLTLAIWALFGGAIHRIVALHAAREEKISITQALRFACGKWVSFFTAPLIPLIVILIVGGIIVLGSLVGNLWGAGIAIVGIFHFLALIAGLMIAFILVGLISGCGLMYPTIAVEGSDSFDAISRSFAYVFARPWRAALYSLVSLVYGVICYLFVRLFIFLAMSATHIFMRWGIWQGGAALGESDKVPVVWPHPTWPSLRGSFQWEAMGPGEHVAAFFIWIWVSLLAGLAVAFLLSYGASATTMIYYLLRRQVDATDLDDVYVQETQETPAETPAAPTAPGPQTPPAGTGTTQTPGPSAPSSGQGAPPGQPK